MGTTQSTPKSDFTLFTTFTEFQKIAFLENYITIVEHLLYGPSRSIDSISYYYNDDNVKMCCLLCCEAHLIESLREAGIENTNYIEIRPKFEHREIILNKMYLNLLKIKKLIIVNGLGVYLNNFGNERKQSIGIPIKKILTGKYSEAFRSEIVITSIYQQNQL